MNTVTIGVDVGKSSDPTAIAVARVETHDKEQHFYIPHLSRVPLGTTYPKIASRITEIVRGVERILIYRIAQDLLANPYTPEIEKKARESIWVLMDATGVGNPVVDYVREMIPEISVCGVIFSYSEHSSVRWRAPEGVMGKHFLVSRLQLLIQSKRIHLPYVKEREILIDELKNYEMQISKSGTDTYGAFKKGTHDDMVTALGLATLLDHKKPVRIGDIDYV